MSISEIRGTYTALVTPFNDDQSIDFEAFEKLIEFQIKNGIDGIVVCGSTGESATLSAKEKLSLIIKAVEHSNGRVPIIAGTGSNDTKESIDMTVLAKEHGADAVLLVSPPYNRPSQEGLYYHYKAIADAVDIPQILYNIPSRSGNNITASTQLALAKDCPNIIGTKEASGDWTQIMEIIQNRPKGFSVISGEDNLAVPLIAMGADGVIGVIPNYAPKQYKEAIDQALKGNAKRARRLHYKLNQLMLLNGIEMNPTPVKAALGIMGMLKPNYRLPILPMHEKNEKKLKRAMKRAKLI